MDKMTYINDVIAAVTNIVPKESLDFMKSVMIAKLSGVSLVKEETALSTEVYDNDWIIRRYEIDLIATEHSPRTVEAYKYTLKKFFRVTGLNYQYVKSQDIIDYIAVMKFKEHISPRYAVGLQKNLRAFYRWAWRHRHIDDDIMRDMESVKVIEKAVETLTDQEVVTCRRAILMNAEKKTGNAVLKESALFELMMSSGLRVGEIANLNVENISFDTNTISIIGEKNYRKRVVPMSDSCKTALKDYLNGRTNGAVFLARGGVRASNYSIERMAKHIGVIGKCHCCTTVHVFRKTFASMLYQKTGDIYLVSKILGHSSPKVTSTHYLKEDESDIVYKTRKAV